MTDLSIIVVSWNTCELTLACLKQIEDEFDLRATGASPSLSLEVIVVDNGSIDGTGLAVTSDFPWVELVSLEENRGFAGGSNAGLDRANGRIVLLLNTDALLTRDAVTRCLDEFERRPQVAVVGAQLVHPDGRLQNSIHAFPGMLSEIFHTALLEWVWPARFPSKRYTHREPILVDAVLGAALFARREAIDQVGHLCEDYFFFLEETDWCLRMREAGWQVLHVPDARIVHLSGATAKRVPAGLARIEFHRSLYHFLRVHRGIPTLAAAKLLRVARATFGILLLWPLSFATPKQRRRLAERWQLLRWHLQGCPSELGLAQYGVDERLKAESRSG